MLKQGGSEMTMDNSPLTGKKSGQFICYKTGQLYLLFTVLFRRIPPFPHGAIESSGARESHPRALRELDVTVSRHPAPIVQPWPERVSNGQTKMVAYALCPTTNATLDDYALSISCISGLPTEQECCLDAEGPCKGLIC